MESNREKALLFFNMKNKHFSDTYINAVRLPKTSDATNTFNGSAVTATGYGWTKNSSYS
jgi:hypothetical protein